MGRNYNLVSFPTDALGSKHANMFPVILEMLALEELCMLKYYLAVMLISPELRTKDEHNNFG